MPPWSASSIPRTAGSPTTSPPLRLLPGTNAEHRRLVAVVSAGRGPLRRYVCLFDCHNDRPQPRVEATWTHPIAPTVVQDEYLRTHPVELLDVNGDGRPDLLLGSAAVANGYTVGTTADTNSYIYALDAADGRELWRTHTGGMYSRTYVRLANLDGTGPKQLIAMVTAPHENALPQQATNEGRLLLLNPADGSPRATYRAGAAIISWDIADLDGDGREEILVTDPRGQLHVVHLRDGRLEVGQLKRLAPSRYDGARMQIDAVADLDGDHLPEIVVRLSHDQTLRNGDNPGFRSERPVVRYVHEPQLLVLNFSLRIRARHKVAELWETDPGFRVFAADFIGTGRPQILLNHSDQFTLFGYQ